MRNYNLDHQGSRLSCILFVGASWTVANMAAQQAMEPDGLKENIILGN